MMEHSELELQEKLKILLTENFKLFNLDVKILCKNEFKNISTHWAEKPDLVIFHNIEYYNPLLKKNVLESPIGLEFKNADQFNNITKGVIDQLQKKYLNKKYMITETKEEFELKSLCFSTTTAIKNGFIYERNHKESANFFIERFCWRGNVAVLLKFQNDLCFSFVNYYFKFNGIKFSNPEGDWK